MTNNPYEPPNSDIKVPDFLKGSPVKAVSVAAVADILGTILLSAILGIAYAVFLTIKGLSQEEITAVMENIDYSSPFYIMANVLGGLITLVCGYLCARIGRCKDYRIIHVYLLIMFLFGAVMSASQGEEIFSAKNCLMTILTFGAGYLGAWLYISKNKKNAV